ncbi:MAG: MG2 domain-containing protein [Bacteroidales bacterium]|nr:MG2 domain-containing protein [Bacteroidales bacterium]
MKSIPKQFGTILAIILLAISHQSFSSAAEADFEKKWKAIDQLFQKGLPKSAAEKIEDIRALAIAQQNQPQLLKTIIYQFKVIEQTEENALPASIDFAKAQFKLLDTPTKAVLHTLIAELYSSFYQQNRYRLLERQYESSAPGNDLMRWNLKQLRDTIQNHFQKSLPELASFDTIPLIKYAAILSNTEKESLELQPTLFDFLAQRNIQFHLTEDAGINKSIAIDQKIFEQLWLPASDFALAKLPSINSDKLHALRLMQPLLRSNLSHRHYEAYVYNDMKRFETVYALSNQADADKKMYEQALQNLQNYAAAMPVSTEITAVRASFLMQQQNSKSQDITLLTNNEQALELCEAAIQNFPESKGVIKCKQLKADILTKSLQVETQAVVLPKQPIPAKLEYRNIQQAYFRLIKMNSDQLAEIRKQPEVLQQNASLSKLPALKSWHISLPFESDYNNHSSLIALPELDRGLYVLLVSYQEDFAAQTSVFGSFQVSKLSFVQHKQAGQNRFYVRDRNSGKPVNKATANIMVRNYDYQLRDYVIEKVFATESGKDGSFSVTENDGVPANRAFYVELFHKGDTLYSSDYFDLYKRKSNDRKQTKSWFFTDRSIYRPGQTVYFKGITLEKQDKDFEIVSGQQTEVELLDANSQKVGALQLTTNDFGSFDGQFALPLSGLNGQYRLRNSHGSTSFAVEAYKRPEFEVLIEEPEKQFKLNETVIINGEARAFAGFALDSVWVNYVVERAVDFPYWRYWWGMPPFGGQPETIASGSLQTNQEGKFKIPVDLLPKPSVKAHEQPIFNYTIRVDVRDKQGETRSAQLQLRAGYQALMLTTNLEKLVNQQKAEKYKLHARNLQSKAVKSTVKRSFYRMDADSRFETSLWNSLDRQLISDDSLRMLFPLKNFYPKPLEKQSKILIYSDEVNVDGQYLLFPENVKAWQAGSYMLVLEAEDSFGAAVENSQQFTLFNPESKNAIPDQLFIATLSADTAQPGEEIQFVLSTDAPDSRVLVEIWSGDTLRFSDWIKADRKMVQLPYKVQESDRGKLSFQAVMVRFNEVFTINKGVKVPFDNRKLNIELLSLRDQLQPGADESWELIIRNANKQAVNAELLAGMYDASLDQIKAHNWYFDLLPAVRLQRPWSADQGFFASGSNGLYQPRPQMDYWQPVPLPEINFFGLYLYSGRRFKNQGNITYGGRDVSMSVVLESKVDGEQPPVTEQEEIIMFDAESNVESTEEKTNGVPPLRTNFSETAFFYPQLTTDKEGLIRIKFTTPDALTRWKLMLLAHDKNLHFGQKEYAFTSSKPLMIMGNLPRFYYEGDTAFLMARIVNTGNEIITGIARLELFDAISMEPLQLLADAVQKPFVQLKPGESRVVSWQIQPHGDHNLIALKFSATAGQFTDAEQKILPVLSRKTLVTETKVITVKGNSSADFVLEKPQNQTTTKQLVLNLSCNPVWYAIQALPYLAENKRDNADQVFYRLYTNMLAAHIAQQIPQLMATIEQWKNQSPEAFLSQLEKDSELKNIVLNETPWVLDAKDEATQKAQIALLFDLNKLRYEQQQSLQKLRQLQLNNGAWPWFEGMTESYFITRTILQGFGQLLHLGLDNKQLDADNRRSMELISRKARSFVQGELTADYTKLREKSKLESYTLSSTHLSALYALSFFEVVAPEGDADDAQRFFLKHIGSDWLDLNPGMQAMAALVLNRSGRKADAEAILASLRERALVQEDMGMYWKQNRGYYWYQAPVENQSMLIAAFDEIAGNDAETDQMRQWLLSQKRTQSWETSRATAEAIYAILLRGTDWIANQKVPTASLNGNSISFTNSEAGTGFVQQVWQQNELNENSLNLEIENPNPQMIWGGLFHQYEAAADAVSASGGPLKVSRKLFKEVVSGTEIKREPIKERRLKVGDLLVVQLYVESDRDMEYIHLRDQRAAGLEPIEQLSGYQFKDGLAMYQASGDSGTDFFINMLPKGKYLLEYKLRVSQVGSFNNGFATLQSFYAPEFSSHSKGERVKITE